MKNWCETCRWGKTPWAEKPPCGGCGLDPDDPENGPFSQYQPREEDG